MPKFRTYPQQLASPTPFAAVTRGLRDYLDRSIGHAARQRQMHQGLIEMDDAALRDLGLHRSQVTAFAFAAE